jgi:hypothetical protein
MVRDKFVRVCCLPLVATPVIRVNLLWVMKPQEEICEHWVPVGGFACRQIGSSIKDFSCICHFSTGLTLPQNNWYCKVVYWNILKQDILNSFIVIFWRCIFSSPTRQCPIITASVVVLSVFLCWLGGIHTHTHSNAHTFMLVTFHHWDEILVKSNLDQESSILAPGFGGFTLWLAPLLWT